MSDRTHHPALPRPAILPWQRLAASVLIIGMLLTIVMPPLAFQTRGPSGSSPSIAALYAPVRGLSEFLHTDRGYAFFAPDPGSSHLIQAAVTDADGNVTEVTYPDLDRQWPRLLYHRYFMLAETFHSMFRPPVEVTEDPRQSLERRRYERLWTSIVRRIAAEHDVTPSAVATRRIEHIPPRYNAYVNDPIPLDDPRLYRVLLDQPSELTQTDETSQTPIAPEPVVAPEILGEPPR